MYRMRMVDGSTHGFLSSWGIFGSSYVIVFTRMCAITCVLEKVQCVVCDFGTNYCREW